MPGRDWTGSLNHLTIRAPQGGANKLLVTRSLGALQAPTSSWGPFGPRLRPSRPSGAQAARPTQVTETASKNLFVLTHADLR